VGVSDGGDYVPPPESQGGWRHLGGSGAVRERAGLDPDRLALMHERQVLTHGGESWSILVIRRGWLAAEWHTFNILVPSRFDIWSCTKSLTGTAWGVLIGDSREGRAPGGRRVDLDTPAYGLIPAGHPLTDPRKARITLGHLLTMTSGLPGEETGVIGMPTAADVGPFEHALGRAPNRFGRSVATLAAEPGTRWDYCDPGIAHLALAFREAAGRDLHPFLEERVLRPIGVEGLSWDVQGGSGFMGPHTNAHTGVHVSARELARLGYLYLRGGSWAGERIVPAWWVELATRSSQVLNPRYGYACWVNTDGSMWPALPRDAFAFVGFRSNRCYVVPSLDLVVVRIGSGPTAWDEQELIGRVVDAVRD